MLLKSPWNKSSGQHYLENVLGPQKDKDTICLSQVNRGVQRRFVPGARLQEANERRLNESPQFQQLKKLVASKSKQVSGGGGGGISPGEFRLLRLVRWPFSLLYGRSNSIRPRRYPNDEA